MKNYLPKEAAYKDSDALDQLAHRIAEVTRELGDARLARWKAFYSKNEPDHIGGKCRKLDGAVRHQTGLDFFILIHLRTFSASDDFHKVRMICHELYHIEKKKEAFEVKRHEGDFCEIAEHDSFSYRIALKAMGELGIKYDKPEEVKKYAHIERLDGRSTLAKTIKKDDWTEMDSLTAKILSAVERGDQKEVMETFMKVGELLHSIEGRDDAEANSMREKWKAFGDKKIPKDIADKFLEKK